MPCQKSKINTWLRRLDWIILALIWAYLLCVFCLTARGNVTLQWDLPTNPVPTDILIFHGTDSQPPELYDVGVTNCWSYTNQLSLGAHYFAATAFYATEAPLKFSAWSNMAVVTNVTAVNVQSVVFTSTNLADWSPIQTNHILLCATNPAEFYRTTTAIAVTNQVLLPPAPH